MFGIKLGGGKPAIKWNDLSDLEQLDQIDAMSHDKPQVIFKHSTRCFISSSVLSSFERNWSSDQDDVELHLLDLIQYRTVSNEIARKYKVHHQSPQIILIVNGRAIYNASHNSISSEEILNHVK